MLGNGPKINGQPASLMVGYGPNHPTTPHHRAAFCPATGPCEDGAFNGAGPSFESKLGIISI